MFFQLLESFIHKIFAKLYETRNLLTLDEENKIRISTFLIDGKIKNRSFHYPKKTNSANERLYFYQLFIFVVQIYLSLLDIQIVIQQLI